MLRSLVVFGLAVASAPAFAAGTIYQWRGGTSGAWGLSGNWISTSGTITGGPAPTNGLFSSTRLQVTNNLTTGFELVYDAANAITTYSNVVDRPLVIASPSQGRLHITGGTFRTLGSDAFPSIIANGATGILLVDGGEFYGHYVQFGANSSGSATLTVSNTALATLRILNYNMGSAGIGNLNLDGGTLNLGVVTKTQTGVNNFFNFNGGTLVLLSNNVAIPNSLTRANVRNGGAKIDTAGFNVTIAQALLHTTNVSDAAIDGGLTKNGNGTLTLSGVPTYTGPTRVNAGRLTVPLPVTSSALVLADGTRFTPTLTNSPWLASSAALTNATVDFNFGSFAANPNTNASLYFTNLAISGSVTCNITGTGFPVTNITLLSYGSKTGGGSFVLGTLPTGAAATINDDGANVTLNITSPSIQNLIWSASVNNNWATNEAANWNTGAANYLEYPSGVNDLVTFNDTSGGAVNITSQVNPSSTTVDVTSSFYTFSGPGSIGGTNGIVKTGTSTLTICNSNNFSGPVTISGGSGTTGGTLFVSNSFALGSSSAPVTVNGPANTLEIGIPGGTGIGVTNQTVTINGTGVGGAKGALRGAATASGDNVWAGPVIIGNTTARIGTEDNGNLTVSGNITDNGVGLGILFRVGNTATLTVAGTGNNWGGSSSTFGAGAASVVKLGANNALPVGSALGIGNCTLDLNGFNQTVPSLFITAGGVPATSFLTDSGAAATLTVNATNGNTGFTGDVTGSLALVKTGSNTLTLGGANITYTGATTVSQGQLTITNAAALATSITVAGGATLNTEAGTTGTLTLNANSILVMDAGTPGAITAASIDATASPINVSFSIAPTPAADVLVMSASGGITGSAANFQVLGTRSGTFYLASGNTELHYIAPATATTLTWKGNDSVNPTFWDVATTTNWSNAGNPDRFFTGDLVVFDDTASSFAVTIPGTTILPASVTFSNSANAYTVAGGSISGATAVVKHGASSVTFSNANGYTGGTILNDNSGTLIVNSTSGLGTGAVAVGNNSTLQLNSTATGTATTFGNTFTGNGTLKIFLQTDAAANTTVANVGGFNGTIELANDGTTADKYNTGVTAPGASVKIDAGSQLYIPGSATFANIAVVGTGNTENRGAIRISGATSVLTGNVSLLGDATFGLENVAATLNGNISATAAAGNTNTLTLGTANSTQGGILSGALGDGAGGGRLALKQAAGTATLSGGSTYSGGTSIGGGVLVAANASALGVGPVAINTGATRLVIGDGLAVSNDIVFNGGGATARGVIENSGGGTATLAGGTITIGGSLSAGGHFASAGGGLLVVSNPIVATVANNVVHRIGTTVFAGGGSYGGFTVAEGTARLGANNGLCVTSLVSIAGSAAANWDLAGFSQTVAGIQRTTGNTATIINSSVSGDSTLTLTGTSSYSGLISDNGLSGSRIALIVNGGNLSLSGTNTYSGGTTVTNGTLRINTTTAAGLGMVAVNNGGLLGGTGTVSGDTTMDAGSTLAPGNNGIGTLTFSGNLSIAGNIFVEVNTSLAQSNDLANVTGTLSCAGSGTLTVTNIGTNTLVAGDYFKLFSQPLAGGGALTIVGPAGATFTNNLAVDGSISVLSVAAIAPPNLNFTSLGGGQVQFSWTGSGILQSQTNTLSTGLSTNWGDYPGGGSSPVMVTIDPSKGSVFFRVKQ